MNLKDILKDGISVVENEKSGIRIGENNQVQILGYIGKYEKNSEKIYLVKCNTCAKDPELFGEGYFVSMWGRMKHGQLPCGCSKSVKWTKEQLEILCERISNKLGYKFIKLNFNNGKSLTKIKADIICEKHGIFKPLLSNYLYKEWGCRKCGAERTADSVSYSDDEITKLYVKDKNLYPEGTTFKRLDITDKKGHKIYVEVYCPICDATGVGTVSTMSRGSRFCECILENQKYAYILSIGDGFLKFGIAANVNERVRTIKRTCTLEVELIGFWIFEDKFTCRLAERICKQTLDCSVVDKYKMPDGWTETTNFQSLDSIIKIYEENGGERVA